MSADTYSQDAMIEFLNRNELVVPLRAPFDLEPQATRYGLRWTPYMLVLEPDGTLRQRAYGYQSPAELIPWIMLGAAKGLFVAGDWPAAQAVFEAVYRGHPRCASAPEAMYLGAVSRYRQNRDVAELKGAHLAIKEAYPDSVYTERTSPYLKL